MSIKTRAPARALARKALYTILRNNINRARAREGFFGDGSPLCVLCALCGEYFFMELYLKFQTV